ncbi:palmitoyltransferase ZDHHC20-B-like [Haemaphysalis longicornis]
MPRGFWRCVAPMFDWIPVIAVLALLGWAYYSYVFVVCGSLVKVLALRALLALVFSVLLLLVLWSFLHTTFTGPAPIPAYFGVSSAERQRLNSLQDPNERRLYLDELGDKRGILTLGPDECVRYCEPCRRIKPDRCHHCTRCKKCVPKMDHHCPWFNNCVSFSTHKSFLLTLAYGSVLAAFTALTALIPAASAWLSLGLSFTALNVSCVVAGGAYLSIAVAAFMCVQLGYLYRNVTTLENMRPTLFREQTDSFDLGRKKNVLQVFGTDRLLWPFPVHTSQGDGSRYPTKLHPNPYDLRLPLVQKNKPVPPASTEAKPTGASRGPSQHHRLVGRTS